MKKSGLLPWVVNVACLIGASSGLYLTLAPRAEVPKRSQTSEISISAVKGVKWSAHPRTLVMAIRPGCRWCTASAPFYRELVSAAADKNFHLIAVTPGTVPDTRRYMQSLQVEVGDVLSANFVAMNVAGTPTLILVDQSGRVESVWVGLLLPEKQNDLRRALGLPTVAVAAARD